MRCDKLSTYIRVIIIIVVASGVSKRSLGSDAAQAPEKLVFSATEEGRKESILVVGYRGRYTYRGPADLDVLGENQIVRYGKLRVGFALPIAGGIYRLDSADDQQAVFVKVPERELSPEMKLTAGSYALPLNSKGILGSWQFKVDHIGGIQGKRQVTIRGFDRGHSLSGTYRAGDAMNVDGSLHRILNIVPAQERFEGWIEIEMKASEEPMSQKRSLEVCVQDDRLEILLGSSTEARGRMILYPKDEHRQAAIDFLVDHEGFTLPFLSSIYRVEQVNAQGIRCRRLPDHELPAKWVPAQGNYLLPIALVQNLDGWDYRVEEISLDGNLLTARFEGLGEAAGKLGSYKVGDKIVFNGTVRRVVNIVPSHEGEKRIGWVEVR